MTPLVDSPPDQQVSVMIRVNGSAGSSDTAPDFGSATVANQSYTQNTAISNLTLPAATGGNGDRRYTLTPAPPAGLTFTASTRVLSGTADSDPGRDHLHLQGDRHGYEHGGHAMRTR